MLFDSWPQSRVFNVDALARADAAGIRAPRGQTHFINVVIAILVVAVLGRERMEPLSPVLLLGKGALVFFI